MYQKGQKGLKGPKVGCRGSREPQIEIDETQIRVKGASDRAGWASDKTGRALNRTRVSNDAKKISGTGDGNKN